MNMDKVPQVVVEVDPSPKRADTIRDDREREDFIDFIARHGEAGVEIPDTGGLRRVRWSRRAMGRRAGARVVHFDRNVSEPICLIAIYAKAEKEELLAHEKAALRRAVAAIKAEIQSSDRGG